MAKVLLLGYMRELMEERGNFLRAAGHEVTLAFNAADAFSIIEREPCDLAILGFSIPDDERQAMATAIKRVNPNAGIIMIYFTSVKNTELADALLQTTASAEDVLRAVTHLLKSKNQSRTG